jgi:hypothetical protein
MHKSEFSPLQPVQAGLLLELARMVSGQAEWREFPDGESMGIIRLAIAHGLAPLLWWRLQQRGRQISDFAGFADLEDTAKIAEFNYRVLRDNQSRVQLALSEAGIPVLWIKGIALAQAYYPQAQLRPMQDLDGLVPYEQRQAALQVVQRLGFQIRPGDALDEVLGVPEAMAHHYPLLGVSAGGVDLEIHYRLLDNETLLPLREMEWFWQEAGTIGQGEEAFRVPKLEAHFLYLCAHAILQHGEADFHLQRYYDLHLLASQAGMDWEWIIRQAKKLGWTYTVRRALEVTRGYFSSPVPRHVLDALEDYQPSDQDARHARRLQGSGRQWEGTLLSFSGMRWGERMRQLFHLAFPPAEFMRKRYGIPAGRGLLPSYLLRWWEAARAILAARRQRLRSRK